MTIKEEIFQELENLPESTMPKILELIRSIKAEEESNIDDQVWQAYLDSEREREEVYRRLANS